MIDIRKVTAMEINGPQSQPPNGASNVGDAPKAAGASPSGDQTSAARPDAEVVSTNIEYIRRAQAGEDVDAKAVAEARALLSSGKLDTPQAARRAAENILKHGF
jgi:hypothetical protein